MPFHHQKKMLVQMMKCASINTRVHFAITIKYAFNVQLFLGDIACCQKLNLLSNLIVSNQLA